MLSSWLVSAGAQSRLAAQHQSTLACPQRSPARSCSLAPPAHGRRSLMRLTWGLRSRPRSRPVCSETASPQVQPIFEAASLLLPADEHDGKPLPAMFRRAGIHHGDRSSTSIRLLKLFLARCSSFSDEDLISQLFAMVLNGSYADPANNGDFCRRVKQSLRCTTHISP